MISVTIHSILDYNFFNKQKFFAVYVTYTNILFNEFNIVSPGVKIVFYYATRAIQDSRGYPEQWSRGMPVI